VDKTDNKAKETGEARDKAAPKNNKKRQKGGRKANSTKGADEEKKQKAKMLNFIKNEKKVIVKLEK